MRVSVRSSWCLQTTFLKLLLLLRRDYRALIGVRSLSLWTVEAWPSEEEDRPSASRVLSGRKKRCGRGCKFGGGLPGEPRSNLEAWSICVKTPKGKIVNIPTLVPLGPTDGPDVNV